ncbi:uncharacterized protein LOC127152615 [Labeo rohita]|uniref:uncharacterized protein LOC127152615 n=1 Tax=Labeo rohita TaxID=84645 RepID=UPI0021E2C46C|nr:uncharacterized protein LOC127152615 [Labeo rohita]
MSFLLPHLNPRSSRCSLDPIQPLEDTQDPIDLSAIEEDVERTATPTSQRCNTPTPPSGPITSTPHSRASPTPAHPRIQAILSETRQSTSAQTRPARDRRRQVVSEAEQQLLDIISIPTSNVPPHVPTAQEEMYYFALSLVPRLNRLSREAQAQAQTHFLTYLTELEDRQLAQMNTPGPIRGSHSSTSTAFHPYSPTFQARSQYHPVPPQDDPPRTFSENLSDPLPHSYHNF